MKEIRIGNDINVLWLFKGDNLEGLDLCIELTDPKGNKRIIDDIRLGFGNLINFTLKGTELKFTGDYNLTIWKNKGKDGQTCYDYMKAFKLIPFSGCCDELGEKDLSLIS